MFHMHSKSYLTFQIFIFIGQTQETQLHQNFNCCDSNTFESHVFTGQQPFDTSRMFSCAKHFKYAAQVFLIQLVSIIHSSCFIVYHLLIIDVGER